MADCLLDPASEETRDFILQYLYAGRDSLYGLTGIPCASFLNGEYLIVYARAENVPDLNISDYSYAAIPKLYGLMDEAGLEASGIPPAFDLPALNATGRGVILGFIDTGIDYTDPLFRNADGTTRILGLWDQSLENKTPPQGDASGLSAFFPYGTIFSREDMNAALASEDPLSQLPSRDENGHGTRMARIAAGRDNSRPGLLIGAAPEAWLAAVKLKPAKQYLRDFFLLPEGVPAFQENDIMSGVSYLLRLALSQGLPLVICLGLGTAQGSHDGTAPLAQLFQSLYGYPGLSVITAAGNETGYRRHYYGNMTKDQIYEDVELRIGAEERGFCAELWAREPDLFTVGFVSPSGEEAARIPLSLGKNTKIPFRLSRTEITINYVNYEAGSGSQLIFMRFQAPDTGIWRIRVYPVIHATGQFHIWLPLRQFGSDDTYFLRPDPDTTIVDPGNASMPTTIAAYDERQGSIRIHSSRGFTRAGQIKPDVAAPGAGTSEAAALAAGAAADIFTWAFTDRNDLTLSGAAAQSMLIRGAVREDAFLYPSREWGYGKLNLFRAFSVESE